MEILLTIKIFVIFHIFAITQERLKPHSELRQSGYIGLSAKMSELDVA